VSKTDPASGGRGRPSRWKQFEREFLAGLPEEQQRWLQLEIGPDGPVGLPDLLALSRNDLLRLFPGPPVKVDDPERPPRQSLNDRRTIRALAWQLAMRIGSGDLPRLDGNMRTGWYRFIEPFYLEKDLLDSDLGPELDPLRILLPEDAVGVLEEAQIQALRLDWLRAASPMARALNRAARERYVTNAMTEAFDDLYLAGILDFEDHFGFIDPGEARYHVGRKKARKVLATEKLGLTVLARRMGTRHGISWYVSNGEPSLLGLSFAAKKLKRLAGTLDVGSVTDYDPFGYSIAGSFSEKFMSRGLFGPGSVRHVRLTGSEALVRRLFTPAGLERAKRDLNRYHRFKQKQILEWMGVTGGVDGQAVGVHIDLADMQRLEAVIEDWVLDRLGDMHAV